MVMEIVLPTRESSSMYPYEVDVFALLWALAHVGRTTRELLAR